MATNRNEYIENFKKEKYDRIVLQLPKGSKTFLQTQAAIRGKKSVTELVTDAIESYCDTKKNRPRINSVGFYIT